METNEENVRRALSTTKLQAVAVFEVLQLQTGNHSVDEYTEEFQCLYFENNLDELEFRTVAKYVGGLKQKIYDELYLELQRQRDWKSELSNCLYPNHSNNLLGFRVIRAEGCRIMLELKISRKCGLEVEKLEMKINKRHGSHHNSRQSNNH